MNSLQERFRSATFLSIALSFLLLQILSLWSDQSSSPGTIRFVQITDVHLFDAGKDRNDQRKVCDDYVDNLSAFRWALHQTETLQMNSHSLGGPPKVSFLVFTGDFGLEQLSPDKQSPTYSPCKDSHGSVVGDLTLEEAADRVAQELRKISAIIPVYFVPGNNDLKDENPSDLTRYKTFVDLLEKRLNGNSLDLTAGPVHDGDLTVLGLNTASFKATKDETTRVSLSPAQGGDLKPCSTKPGEVAGPSVPLASEPHRVDLLSQLALPSMPAENGSVDVTHSNARERALEDLQRQARVSDGSFIIFTHVPDAPDPVSNCNNPKSGSRLRYRSSWFLTSEERDLWDSIASTGRLAGIFAGHFHSPETARYGTLVGPESLNSRSSDTLRKTYIAPPLAIKFQSKSRSEGNGTARGLMLVDLKRQPSGWLVVTEPRPAFVATSVIGAPAVLYYDEASPDHRRGLDWILALIGMPVFLGALIFSAVVSPLAQMLLPVGKHGALYRICWWWDFTMANVIFVAAACLWMFAYFAHRIS